MKNSPKDVQSLISSLRDYYVSEADCIEIQPFSTKVGAATFHPQLFFGSIEGLKHNLFYIQPCFRPTDGRYGENPNRLQHYFQVQVVISPRPKNIREIYLKSLDAIGISSSENDIQFLEDNWESPTLSASGLGWEVRCNGMEVTQFTYFQTVGSLKIPREAVEISYGLERIAMHTMGVENVYDLPWNADLGISYGDMFLKSEKEMCAFNFEIAKVTSLRNRFVDIENQHKDLIESNNPIAAYNECTEASHVFNLLDARGAISVSSRVDYIRRIAKMSKECAVVYKEKYVDND